MAKLLETVSAAGRSLARSRWFAATVVATLAIGVAPNCIVFAIMDAVYFRPLPYPAQERLVLAEMARKQSAAPEGVDAFSFVGWQAGARAFDRLALYRAAGIDVTVGNRPERLAGQAVTGGFFETLGVAPAAGRAIAESDCVPGAAPVIVISHRAWLEVFDGRRDIVNLPVRVNGAPGIVVGVMPASFTSFREGRAAVAWMPLSTASIAAPGEAAGGVIGRLAPGVSPERARLELNAIHRGQAAAFPERLGDRAVVVRDFRSALFEGLGPGIKMLAVIVGLLLVIACANAANLLVAHAAGRERDVAIRSALGAGRGRLAATLLIEHTTLAAAGSAVGLLLAAWGTRLVWVMAAPLFTRIGVQGFPFDGRVAGFAIGLAVTTAVLAGVGPASRGSRSDASSVLKGGASRGGDRVGRISSGLVVGQVALCVVTLLVTALMARSFVHFSGLASNPGFDPTGLVVATVPAPAGASDDPSARAALLDRIVSALPSSQKSDLTALTDRLPFLEGGRPVRVGAEAASRIDAAARVVNAAYFSAFPTALLKGRRLSDRDTREAPAVAVVDERLATALGADDPVGRTVIVDGTQRTIVGVVAAATRLTPFQPPSREIFIPYQQAAVGEMKIVVRSRMAPTAVAAALRARVAAVDRDLPLVSMQPLAASLDDFMTPFRLMLGLISVFGGAALLLAALGLYSIMARDVARRSREIGIRMALGADRRSIVATSMRRGLRPALMGLGIGLLLGGALTRILPSELLGVSGLAAWHYPAAVLVWLAAASAACAVPARRAASVDPLVAFRCE